MPNPTLCRLPGTLDVPILRTLARDPTHGCGALRSSCARTQAIGATAGMG